MKPMEKGMKRILKAFGYSYAGFKAVLAGEEAFRQELILCTILTGMLFFIPITVTAKCILFASLLLILMAELINTAVETVIDRISPDYNELSKKAKDIGSLLVLLAFINALVLWIGFLYVQWKS